MEKDMNLSEILPEPWSNNACRGYVIWAMESCGFSKGHTKRKILKIYKRGSK